MKKNLFTKLSTLLFAFAVLSMGNAFAQCSLVETPTTSPQGATTCSGDEVQLSFEAVGTDTDEVLVEWSTLADGNVFSTEDSPTVAPTNLNCAPVYVGYQVKLTCPDDPAETKAQNLFILVFPTDQAADPEANTDVADFVSVTTSGEDCSVNVVSNCVWLTVTPTGTSVTPDDPTATFNYTYNYPADVELNCLSGSFDVTVEGCEPEECTADMTSTTASDIAVVSGTSIDLDAFGTVNIGNGVYSWSGSDGFAADGSSVVSVPVNDGCDPIDVTYTATIVSDEDPGCTDSASVTVTVYPTGPGAFISSDVMDEGCTVMVISSCDNVTISNGGSFTAGEGESGTATFTATYNYPDGVTGAGDPIEIEVDYDCPAAAIELLFEVSESCNEFTEESVVTITITNGTGPYSITGSLNDDGYEEDILPPLQFSDGETYSITVTDANGNTGTISGSVNCSKACVLEGVEAAIDCNEISGNITVLVTIPDGEGEAPYTITTDDEGVTVASAIDEDGNVLSNSFEIGPYAPFATYNLTVTDGGAEGNECTVELTDNVGDCQTVDISLLSFNGSIEENGNLLTWITASETNNQFFVIERSIDGVNFQEIDRVDGNGTTQTAIEYTYTDKDYQLGANYYRLSQVDFDGSTTVASDVIVLERGGVAFVFDNIYPVPTSDFINITLRVEADNTFTSYVYDNSGRLVFNEFFNVEAGTNNITIEAAHLSPGTYIIAISDGNEVSTKRFIKN